MKLYLKSQHRKKPREPILNFLKRYFKNLTLSTFLDEQCDNLQCSTGKNRSIDEMLIIVKTEYPKSKNSDIYKAFRKLLLENESKNGTGKLSLLYCKDINKWVFMKYIHNCNTRFILNYSNSVEKKDLNGNGKETYNSFMTKLGFTMEELHRENTNS
jgi:hypothetical protein